MLDWIEYDHPQKLDDHPQKLDDHPQKLDEVCQTILMEYSGVENGTKRSPHSFVRCCRYTSSIYAVY